MTQKQKPQRRDKLRNAYSHQKLREAGRRSSPEPLKGESPWQHLSFDPVM